MRLGLNIDAQLEGRKGVEHVKDIFDQVLSARDNGFELVSTGQHFLTQPMGMLQPVPLLAAIAARVPDIRVITGVLLAVLDNPVRLAETLATLDVISEGRLIVGMGSGYREEEFNAFGIDRPISARFLSVVDTTRRLLEGEAVTSEEFEWNLNEARLTLPPTQSPRPRIWLAANNDRSVGHAALHADGWMMNPHAKISTLARQVSIFRNARQESGADPGDLPLMREVFVMKSSSEAHDVARPYLEQKYKTYVRWGQGSAQPADDPLDLSFDELIRERFIVGSPEECAEQINNIGERLGADSLIARVQWSGMPQKMALTAIELLGQHVLPVIS